jgi:hypothetical protein
MADALTYHPDGRAELQDVLQDNDDRGRARPLASVKSLGMPAEGAVPPMLVGYLLRSEHPGMLTPDET